MVNHYIYRTTNTINGMKYIGKRTCYCPIQDDTYLGSGTFLKQAIKIYGEQYFKKEILCTCKTEEEAWEKEKEMIEAFDAIGSEEYYNIAPGGPSRLDGFIIDDLERDKMEYLNNQLQNENYYGVRIEERKYGLKPRIIFVETTTYDGRKAGIYRTIADDTKKNEDYLSLMDQRTKTKYFNNENNIMEWLKNKGYVFISKKTHDDWISQLSNNKRYDEIVDKIRLGKLEIDNKTNTDIIKEIKNEYLKSNDDINSNSNIKRIKELAKTSEDYRYFLNLLNRYNELGLIAVYNAVTGRGSISGDSFKDGNFKCSKADAKKASQILDFESRFTDMIQTIKGRRDYLYVVLGFCYNCKLIDNDELFKRFKRYYNKIKPIKSIEQVICNIDYIYNYRKNKLNKIFIKQEYDKIKRLKER